MPADVVAVSRALVRAGKLTAYQAGALAQGKAQGLVIGAYLVLDKLGAGGMGVVFKARHRRHGRVVALKILPPSFGRDRDAVPRFRREVEVAARLDHPNVVAALDADEDRGVHFLTMEYIEGRDLDRLVRDVRPAADRARRSTARSRRRAGWRRRTPGDRPPRHQAGQPHARPLGAVRVLDLGLARLIEASTTPARRPRRR